MKRKLKFSGLIFSMVILIVCAFASCAVFDGGKDTQPTATEYTIMYTDGDDTHTLTVRYGELYSVPKPLPFKEGYEFMGFYDAEEGGTQYVTSSGMCVTAFYDKKNVVLFPRFETKTVTFLLNYGQSVYVGTETLTSTFGQKLPQLPANLNHSDSDKYEFAGWYTQTDCDGMRVADTSGVSEKNTDDLSPFIDDEGKVRLYAGFKVKTFTVNFYDCKDFSFSWNGFVSTPLYTAEVAYGSSIDTVAPKKRGNGQRIWSWSQTENGSEYTDTITSVENFYVREYEITVSFDTDGGASVPSVGIGNRGGTVSLPHAVKRCFRLIGWEYKGEMLDGGFVMSAVNMVYVAKWERVSYIVTFNSNGGTQASAKEVPIGESCVLPVSTKKAYELSGWSDSRQTYRLNYTPTSDITLFAVWTQFYRDYTYISTVNEFLEIENNLSGKYFLLNDIDLNNSSSFKGFGTFKGVLDGDNHAIIDFHVYYGFTETRVAGLFQYNYGTVKNLKIKGTSSDDEFYKMSSAMNNSYQVYLDYNKNTDVICVGGLVGSNYGKIINCGAENIKTLGYSFYNVGTSETLVADVGALVGYNGSNGEVMYCYATASRLCGYTDIGDTDGNARARVGGIIGKSDGSIESCFSYDNKVESSARGGKIWTFTKADLYASSGGIAGLVKTGVAKNLLGYNNALTCMTIKASGATEQNYYKQYGSVFGEADNGANVSHLYRLSNNNPYPIIGEDAAGASGTVKSLDSVKNILSYSAFSDAGIFMINNGNLGIVSNYRYE